MRRVPARRGGLATVLVAGWLVLGGAASQAGVLRYCDPPMPMSAAQQDVLFRFGALVKQALQESGQGVALIARSGIDLSRFGQRYSHAGVSLKSSPNAPWSVRQLYYDCDERRPRIFDQGILGFVVGGGNASLGYVSVVLLPPGDSASLERVAADNRQALALLGGTYSANAYAFEPRYQNCNQWVAEALAVAWGDLDGEDLRAHAQRWLQAQGYVPTVFDVGDPLLMWLGGVLPWLHRDDHPPQDLAQHRFRVSMPSSIEAFVHSRVPAAQRMEFCFADRRVVIRRGWEPIEAGCRAAADDTVVVLD